MAGNKHWDSSVATERSASTQPATDEAPTDALDGGEGAPSAAIDDSDPASSPFSPLTEDDTLGPSRNVADVGEDLAARIQGLEERVRRLEEGVWPGRVRPTSEDSTAHG